MILLLENVYFHVTSCCHHSQTNHFSPLLQLDTTLLFNFPSRSLVDWPLPVRLPIPADPRARLAYRVHTFLPSSTMALEERLKIGPPCHSLACAIQDCLSRNSYNEEKCKAEVDNLYQCCKAFYQRQGENANTVSCPKASLLRLKMKQRSQGSWAMRLLPSREIRRNIPSFIMF